MQLPGLKNAQIRVLESKMWSDLTKPLGAILWILAIWLIIKLF